MKGIINVIPPFLHSYWIKYVDKVVKLVKYEAGGFILIKPCLKLGQFWQLKNTLLHCTTFLYNGWLLALSPLPLFSDRPRAKAEAMEALCELAEGSSQRNALMSSF